MPLSLCLDKKWRLMRRLLFWDSQYGDMRMCSQYGDYMLARMVTMRVVGIVTIAVVRL